MHPDLKKLVNIWAARRFEQDGKVYYTFPEAALDVFVDEVVSQCASAVQDLVDHRFPASEYPERIKKHFGVEE